MEGCTVTACALLHTHSPRGVHEVTRLAVVLSYVLGFPQPNSTCSLAEPYN